MAEVWKAHDDRVDRDVAVKLLYPHVHPAERQRFAREIQALSRLNHPGVVHIYDLGEEEGRTFFVMELVEGGSFDRLGPYEHGPEGLRLLEAALRVLEALEYLHGQGVIHRDLTPRNILTTREGHPKVMDFGLAYLTDATRHFTRTGYTLGTPQYMAPEQAKGAPLTPQADLYSFGAVLYRTLTGRPPFEGENDQAILYQHVYEPPPPPQAQNPAIPDALARFVTRLLAKTPTERPANAALAHAQLARIIQTLKEELYGTARAGANRSGHYPDGPPDPERLQLAGSLKLGGEVAWPAEPVAHEGILALGTSAHELLLIRTHPLRLEARLPAKDEVTAPALLAPDRVAYASWDGAFRVWDPERRAEHHAYETRAEITASPLSAAGLTYVPSRDGHLYALDLQGAVRWAFEAGGHLTAGPTLYRGLLFIASENGWMYALDPPTGQLRYKVETGPIHAHLPAADGVLILPTWAGEVHGFDPLRREVLWTYDVEGELWGSPAVGHGRVYVGGWSGVLYALDLRTGDEVWRAELGRLTASLSLAQNHLYAATEDGRLIAFRAATGEVVWQAEGMGPIQAAPFPYRDALYVADLSGTLYVFREG